MSQALIRHLRLFCASPNVPPVRQQDGVLAVAGVLERAGLAEGKGGRVGTGPVGVGQAAQQARQHAAREAGRRHGETA